MTDSQTEAKIMAILEGIVNLLSLTVDAMADIVGEPRFLDPNTPKKRFRYDEPDAFVFQVLMCVRIASGLRAAFILLRSGHTTEVGVLIRTIDDFVSQLMFVDEIIENGSQNVTVTQRQFLETYFRDEESTNDVAAQNVVDATKKRSFNYNEGRQKMQAAEARLFGGTNPHDFIKKSKTIDNALSGIVHGQYSSVMEMYGGQPPAFHTQGMPVRFSEYRHFLGLQVHLALNAFFKVAYNLGSQELAEHIRTLRQTFETGPAYSTP